MAVGLVKLVGMAIVACGVVYLVKPQVMKKYINFWMEDKNLYLGGVISVLIGIIFLMAAADCSAPWVIVLVALLSLVKGVLVFLLGPEKIKPWLKSLEKKPAKIIRAMSIVALSLGVLVVLSA